MHSPCHLYDPSIMKFLEEDEDETMHSGADVESFTAALNRISISANNIPNNNTNTNNTNTNDTNINNTTNMNNNDNNTSAPQLPTSKNSTTALSQGTNHTPSQLFQQWQSSKLEVKVSYPNEEDVKPKIQEQKSSAMEVNRHPSGPETQHPPNDTSRELSHVKSEPNRPQDDQRNNAHMSQVTNMQITDKNPAQNIVRNPENEAQLQRLRNQQVVAAGQAANNAMNRPAGKQVPFALLLQVIEPQLNKEKAMQLQGLYTRLRNNNINKEEFVRHMRTLVGDHMLKMAVCKLQQGQTTVNDSAPQLPTSKDSATALSQGTNHTPSQLFQQWQYFKREVKVSYPNEEDVKPKIQEQKLSAVEVNRHASGPETQHPPNDTSRNTIHVKSEPNRSQDDQRNAHMSQVTNVQSTDKNPARNIVRNPENEAQLQRMRNQQAVAAGQAANNAMNRPTGKQVPFALLLPVIVPQLGKEKAMQLQGLYTRLRNNNINKEEFVQHMRTLAGDHMLKMAVYKLQQGHVKTPSKKPVAGQKKPQQGQVNTPPKKPVAGQKKPLEAPVNSLSKKQKVSGAFSDQSIEKLNDVTAVREEEEQLFSGSKEDSRVSEGSRKVVQEEEERLILQKAPFLKKLAEISKALIHLAVSSD